MLTRVSAPLVRAAFFNQHRHMASASASDPVQKLFLTKVREFKANNYELDETHQRLMQDESERLKRVYGVKDDKQLSNLEYKFDDEHHVSLRDLDENKEMRSKIMSGELQKEYLARPKPVSEVLASIVEQHGHTEWQLPPSNHPCELLFEDMDGDLKPFVIEDIVPDYEPVVEGNMTPEKLQELMNVEFGPDMPTILDDQKPERDAVNFPRQTCPHHPPARFYFIPESWFTFFYPKTGVTGPFAFAAGSTTFLVSKEWLIMDHELIGGLGLACAIGILLKILQPRLKQECKELDEEDDGWDAWQAGSIDFLETMKQHYTNELKKTDVISQLYSIREQDLQLQLEGEYRSRLQVIFEDTKRRLDYLVSIADSQRQIAHKNMVNWVISNATSSIGPKQETEFLDSCILDLKELAGRNPNVI